MLGAVLGALGYVAYSSYTVFSDSFVAPLTLSADSDVVISSKLKLDELTQERTRAAAELHGIEAEMRGNETSLQQLRELQAKLQTELSWHSNMSAHKARAGSADLSSLNQQGRLAQTMLSEQEKLVQKAEADLNAGLITRMDYARELQQLRELQRSVLDNQRAVQQGQSNMQEIRLNAQGLKEANAPALGPARLASEEQLTRIGLDIIRLESDMQRQVALSRAALDRFGQIDKLVEELMARPVFKALKQQLDLAFVPYSQLDGVTPNSVVYSCRWGVLFCEPVGRVMQLLEGEVNQADPWGIPTRGQYAVMSLTNRRAAHAKTLRVRTTGTAPTVRSAAISPVSQANAKE
jgi:hypothetical protein